jgi:two-component sensor histidine kinase
MDRWHRAGWLQPDRCWLLGMIVYELITNAARHAFAGGIGWIRVELLCTDAFVECRVLDNGSAPVNFQPGRGLKIVNELTKALGGRFDQKFATGGSTSIVMFPSSSEPQITANRRAQHGMSLASGDTVSVLNLDSALPIPQSNGSSMSRKQR